MDFKVLNSKEVKEIRHILERQYGAGEKLAYSFLLTGNNDIYVANQSIKSLDFKSVRINTIGIYFGELKDDEIRLSIEGSQIIGPLAKKNVFDTDSKIGRMWMYGLDIPCKEEFNEFVIIKSGNDFMGAGRYKEGKILNHVPKGRRIHE